jgi:hypothetical protein
MAAIKLGNEGRKSERGRIYVKGFGENQGKMSTNKILEEAVCNND